MVRTAYQLGSWYLVGLVELDSPLIPAPSGDGVNVEDTFCNLQDVTVSGTATFMTDC